LFNDEVDAVVLGSATAQELQAMFENDTKNAKQVDLANWRRRSLMARLNEVYSKVWQDWL
jgi:cardiolipin synthase